VLFKNKFGILGKGHYRLEFTTNLDKILIAVAISFADCLNIFQWSFKLKKYL
jgi:hypothetical protein